MRPGAIQKSLGELADHVKGRILSDDPGVRELVITGVSDLRIAGPAQIGFLRNPTYLDLAKNSQAGALLVPAPVEISGGPVQVQVGRVDAAFARIAQVFHPLPLATTTEIHPTAFVDPSATVQGPVVIGPHVTVAAGATIGAGTVLMAGTVVGERSRVGRDCLLYPRVTLYNDCSLGDRVILHSGVVIGADGFGYAPDTDGYVRVPQGGVVELADDVELGANTLVDRGTLGVTRIGKGTKIDNMCHIAHNCQIGERVVMAAAGLIPGSTTIGNDVQIGGHVVFNGHIRVGDNIRIGGNSVVDRDVLEPGNYMGYPLVPYQRWWRWLMGHRKRLLKGERNPDR